MPLKLRTFPYAEPRCFYISKDHRGLPDDYFLFSEEIALDLSFNAYNFSVDIPFNMSTFTNGDVFLLRVDFSLDSALDRQILFARKFTFDANGRTY